LAGWLFILALSSVLRAQDSAMAYTLNLPFSANEATPTWLGHPEQPPGPFATLVLPVTPPNAGASLLVTVFFRESNGGFLRINWQAAGIPDTNTDELSGPGETAASSVLCDNFYEGIGMSNQRRLLVSAETMRDPGALRFQCGDSALGISRIKLEWLESSTGLSSPSITDTLVTPASGPTQPASELTGQPPAANDAAWHDRIVDVPVTDVPLRIEQGVDFTVQMVGAPVRARLVLKEAGLPWGQHLVVWINNQRAGAILPVAPDIGDDGYSESDNTPYTGWRDGTFLIPPGILTSGSNALQFSTETDTPPASSKPTSEAAATPSPLAVKNVLLQLDYPALLPVKAAVTTSPPPFATMPSLGTDPAGPVDDLAPASKATAANISGMPDSNPDTSPVLVSTPVPNTQNSALLSLPAALSSTSP
jgi:hypothetical protein